MWSRSVTGMRSLDMTVLLSRLERVECLEDAVGTGIDAARRDVAPRDHAVAIDDEQRARGRACGLVVCTVAPRDLTLRLEVREQREVQLVIPRVGDVAPRVVDGDAQELRVM